MSVSCRYIKAKQLTGHACKELTSKALNLRTGKGNKAISLQKVEHTLSQKVGNDTYVISEVKGVSQMYAFVPVGFVV